MEFFLQTLVKKRHMEQDTMLRLQKHLMAIGSVAALAVVRKVDPLAAAVSCFLNFTHRGHELVNTALTTAVVFAAVQYLS